MMSCFLQFSRFAFGGDEALVQKCIVSAAQPQKQEGTDFDPGLADLLEEIIVQDAASESDIKDLKANMKHACIEAVARVQRWQRTVAWGKKAARVKAKADRTKKLKAAAKAKPRLRALRLRIVRPPRPPPPPLPPPVAAPQDLAIVAAGPPGDALSSAADNAGAARIAAERMHSTPEMMRAMIPAVKGFSIHMCENSLRFKGNAADVSMPSISFGPRSGSTRAEALETYVAMMWAMHGGERPAHSFCHFIRRASGQVL